MTNSKILDFIAKETAFYSTLSANEERMHREHIIQTYLREERRKERALAKDEDKKTSILDDVIERIKLEIDSQIIILTKARKDREFLEALVIEDFRLVVGFLEGLQVDPKRFSANRFEELKKYLLSKGNE